MTAPNGPAKRAAALLKLARRGPFIVDDAMAALGCDHAQANRAIRAARLALADTDYTLTCTPQGPRERWLYELVATWDAGRAWVDNRQRDTESRLGTLEAVARSLVNATDGRTIEGKRARTVEMGVRHTLERLRAIDDS